MWPKRGAMWPKLGVLEAEVVTEVGGHAVEVGAAVGGHVVEVLGSHGLVWRSACSP